MLDNHKYERVLKLSKKVSLNQTELLFNIRKLSLKVDTCNTGKGVEILLPSYPSKVTDDFIESYQSLESASNRYSEFLYSTSPEAQETIKEYHEKLIQDHLLTLIANKYNEEYHDEIDSFLIEYPHYEKHFNLK